VRWFRQNRGFFCLLFHCLLTISSPSRSYRPQKIFSSTSCRPIEVKRVSPAPKTHRLPPSLAHTTRSRRTRTVQVQRRKRVCFPQSLKRPRRGTLLQSSAPNEFLVQGVVRSWKSVTDFRLVAARRRGSTRARSLWIVRETQVYCKVSVERTPHDGTGCRREACSGRIFKRT
jgi:hypothetical protein